MNSRQTGVGVGGPSIEALFQRLAKEIPTKPAESLMKVTPKNQGEDDSEEEQDDEMIEVSGEGSDNDKE